MRVSDALLSSKERVSCPRNHAFTTMTTASRKNIAPAKVSPFKSDTQAASRRDLGCSGDHSRSKRLRQLSGVSKFGNWNISSCVSWRLFPSFSVFPIQEKLKSEKMPKNHDLSKGWTWILALYASIMLFAPSYSSGESKYLHFDKQQYKINKPNTNSTADIKKRTTPVWGCEEAGGQWGRGKKRKRKW